MKNNLTITLLFLAYCLGAQIGVISHGQAQDFNVFQATNGVALPTGTIFVPWGTIPGSNYVPNFTGLEAVYIGSNPPPTGGIILPPPNAGAINIVFPPVNFIHPVFTIAPSVDLGFNLSSSNIVRLVRRRHFWGKLAPVPVVPVRCGVIGFVDSLNSRRPSMLTVISQRDGHIFGAITDSQGFFQINLMPGKYVIAVLNGTDQATLDAVEASVHPGNFSFVKLATVSNFHIQ